MLRIIEWPVPASSFASIIIVLPALKLQQSDISRSIFVGLTSVGKVCITSGKISKSKFIVSIDVP